MNPQVRAVVEAVCAFYGVHPSKIKDRGRARVRLARQVCTYVFREKCNLSWSQIGEQLGYASTSHAAVYAVEDALESRSEVRDGVRVGLQAAALHEPQTRPRSGRRGKPRLFGA